VVCSLLQRLFPETGVGRQGKWLLPCVFLCAVLAPLAGGGWQVSLPTVTATEQVDEERLTAYMQGQIAAQFNETLLAMVNQTLESHGLQAKKVVTDMDIDEEGRIHMGQITVYVEGDNVRRAAAVRQLARQRLGTDVVVAQWEASK
jgi:hypothetical protein